MRRIAKYAHGGGLFREMYRTPEYRSKLARKTVYLRGIGIEQDLRAFFQFRDGRGEIPRVNYISENRFHS